MIYEKDLLEAIAECHGQKNPDARTCAKLASYYTILDHLNPSDPIERGYSYDNKPEKEYKSDTEFFQTLDGITQYDAMALMDELMETLKTIHPRLYNGVLRKLNSLK